MKDHINRSIGKTEKGDTVTQFLMASIPPTVKGLVQGTVAAAYALSKLLPIGWRHV